MKKFISMLMLVIIIILQLNLFVFTDESIAQSEEDVYDVILFWGQSNMVGYCTSAAENRYDPSNADSVKAYSEITGIDEEILSGNGANRNFVSIQQEEKTVYEYVYSSNSLEEITADRTTYGEDLYFTSTDSNGAPTNLQTYTGSGTKSLEKSKGVNMIPQFCKTYYKKTGHKVVAVSAALGGKPIRQFLPYDDEYNDVNENLYIYEALKTKYKAAINYLNGKDYKIGNQLYVVFQGEADNLRSTQLYERDFLRVHNNLKNDLGITLGAICETSTTIGRTMAYVKNVHDAQEQLILENDDIILGSSYSYDRYVTSQADYANCTTKITYDENGNKLDYNTAFTNATYSVDYDTNTIHFTSAALSQIGKEVAESIVKTIDSTAPTLEIEGLTTAFVSQILLKIYAYDEETGIKSLRVIDETGIKNELTLEDEVALYNILKNGKYIITAEDRAGNILEMPIYINNIDNINPTITNVTGNPTSWTNEDVTLTVKATDESSGLAMAAYSFDNGETWQISNTKTYTKNTNGIIIKVRDSAGNIATYDTIDITKIDKTVPVLTVSYSTKSATNGDVSATITSNEEIQELNGWTLSSDKKKLTKTYTSNTNGTETVAVKDLAGNTSNAQVSIANIDKTSPQCTITANETTPTNASSITYTFTFNEDVIGFSADDITITNGTKGTLSGSGKIYTLQVTNTGSCIQVVSVSAGKCTDVVGNSNNASNTLTMVVDRTSPNLTVNYSTKDATNGNVLATITSDEVIQAVEGWTLSSDKKKLTKTYTSNVNEIVTVIDSVGNSSKTQVSIANIDKIAPTLNVTYSITAITNKDVMVTITSNEEVKAVEGWTISSDKKKLMKIYANNVNETLEVLDLAGNISKPQISIENIDKILPSLEVTYSITEITNKDVMATIISDEEIQETEGWTLSEDKKSLTKIYSANASETVEVFDIAGNTSNAQVSVENIDKIAPTLNVIYSTTEVTNEKVMVTITSDEEVQEVDGWTLSEDKKSLTKIYTQNGIQTITLADLVGNKTEVKISVKNIEKLSDKVIPKTGEKISTTSIIGICISIVAVIVLTAVIIYKEYKKYHKNINKKT